MRLSERSPQPARRGQPTRRRLGIVAANLSLALVAAACSAESDSAPPTPSEATNTTTSTYSELPTSTLDTTVDVPAPAPRMVTAEVAASWCDNADVINSAAPLFPKSGGVICNSHESGISLSSMTVGGDLNTSVTVSQSPVPLEIIGAAYPDYTCDESQCSRKDTGDVGVYLKASDGLIIGAVYHNLADGSGSEQSQYEALAALARTAIDLVP
jgi:hypothetical protein